MKIKHLLAGLVTASCFAVPAFAAPIQFNIDGISLSNAGGYGQNSEELLDVTFTGAAAPGAFSLDLNGTASYTFNVATIKLNEECINPSSCPRPQGPSTSETDGLDVSVTFHFISPLSGNEIITMTGSANPGPVIDASGNAPADYMLTFAPKEFTFGNGGKFSLDLLDLSFFDNSQQTLTATITLLAAPQAANPGQVPEPATLALMGLGLAGLSVRAKRRKA